MGKQLLAFDTVSLVKEKADYAYKHHLAGLMTWGINDDAPFTSQYSLLKAAQHP